MDDCAAANTRQHPNLGFIDFRRRMKLSDPTWMRRAAEVCV